MEYILHIASMGCSLGNICMKWHADLNAVSVQCNFWIRFLFIRIKATALSGFSCNMSLSFEGVSNLLPYLKVRSSLMLHFMCYDYCSKNYEDTVKINENDHRRIFFSSFHLFVLLVHYLSKYVTEFHVDILQCNTVGSISERQPFLCLWLLKIHVTLLQDNVLTSLSDRFVNTWIFLRSTRNLM